MDRKYEFYTDLDYVKKIERIGHGQQAVLFLRDEAAWRTLPRVRVTVIIHEDGRMSLAGRLRRAFRAFLAAMRETQ